MKVFIAVARNIKTLDAVVQNRLASIYLLFSRSPAPRYAAYKSSGLKCFSATQRRRRSKIKGW